VFLCDLVLTINVYLSSRILGGEGYLILYNSEVLNDYGLLDDEQN